MDSRQVKRQRLSHTNQDTHSYASHDAEALFKQCKERLNSGAGKEALTVLRRTLQADPQSFRLTLYTAYCLHFVELFEASLRAVHQAQSLCQTSTEEQMMAQAEIFFFPFKHLPTEIIAHIFSYVQYDIEHQVDPLLLLNLNNIRLRDIALGHTTLWRKIVWSPMWQRQPPQNSSEANLDFLRQKDSVRPQAILKLYTKYSNYTMEHIDYAKAPGFSEQVAQMHIIKEVKASKNTIRLLRINPSFKKRKLLDTLRVTERGHSSLAHCLFELACCAPLLEDIYVHIHWWQSDGARETISSLTEYKMPPRRGRPLRNLRIQFVGDGLIDCDNNEIEPSILPLINGIHSLTLEGKVRCNYSECIKQAVPSLRHLDIQTGELTMSPSPRDVDFAYQIPALKSFRINDLYTDPSMALNWDLPKCQEMLMPLQIYSRVKGPSCDRLTLIVSAEHHMQDHLACLESLKASSCKTLTFKLLSDNALECLSQIMVVPPSLLSEITRNIRAAARFTGAGNVLNYVEEFNLVVPDLAVFQLKTTASSAISAPASSSGLNNGQQVDINELPTRFFYEMCYPAMDDMEDVFFGGSHDSNEATSSRSTKGGTAVQGGAFRRSQSRSQPPSVSQEDARATTSVSVKRITMKNIRMSLPSYEKWLQKCEKLNISLDIWPNPRVMASLPYDMDQMKHFVPDVPAQRRSQVANFGERRIHPW
ncbi:unnamed protein product [Sympodiomycopsis kandeliae]